MRKIFFLSCLSFCFSLFLPAQNIPEIDALEKKLGAATVDSVRFNCLVNLINEYRSRNTDSADSKCAQLLLLAEKMNKPDSKAEAYLMYAIQLRRKSRYEEAVKYYLLALNLAESVNDLRLAAKVDGSMGIMYWQQNRLDEALACYRKSLAVGRALKDSAMVDNNLNNIGGIYSQKGILDSGLIFFRESMKRSIRDNDASGMAEGYGNIGDIFLNSHQYDSAMIYYSLSIKYSRISGNTFTLMTSYSNVGSVLEAEKKYKEALFNFFNGIDLGRKLDSRSNVCDLYKSVAETYEAMGKHDLAYTYHVHYAELKDSLLNEDNQKVMDDMKAKYESEKKDNRIRMLNDSTALQHNIISRQDAEADRALVLRNGLMIGITLVLALAFFIFRSYRQKQKSNTELAEKNRLIENQKIIVEEKNKNITDSINYAKRIQSAILPANAHFHKILPDAFVYYIPRDIVSGDFYWISERNGKIFLAVADCTGHGVPGAFMSMIGNTLLNEIVNEKNIFSPAEILDRLDTEIRASLKQDAENSTGDGMDIALCRFDFSKNECVYAGANRPLYIVEDDAVKEIPANKFPVGGTIFKREKTFEEQVIQLKKGDCCYLCSDGYADQFGGAKKKKFMSKNLKELFLSVHLRPMREQEITVRTTFEKWKGAMEQVDDVCIIGLKV